MKNSTQPGLKLLCASVLVIGTGVALADTVTLKSGKKGICFTVTAAATNTKQICDFHVTPAKANTTIVANTGSPPGWNGVLDENTQEWENGDNRRCIEPGQSLDNFCIKVKGPKKFDWETTDGDGGIIDDGTI